MYVNQYMVRKEMAPDLRMKIRRYLDYKSEYKKDNKIEENDLEEWLNERLRDKITMILRGKIIDRISFVQGFGIDFKGDISTHFHRATYVSDDFIFMEKDKAECLYYITQGKVAMLHKQSHTFIKDLHGNTYFGELGIINDQPRCLSAKSRDFTEIFILYKNDFIEISEKYVTSIRAVDKIK